MKEVWFHASCAGYSKDQIARLDAIELMRRIVLSIRELDENWQFHIGIKKLIAAMSYLQVQVWELSPEML
jgi:hypothetical protein